MAGRFDPVAGGDTRKSAARKPDQEKVEMSMRLYVTPFAPNALRVQIFMLEKAVTVEVIDVSATQGGEYLELNPLGQVPALELDSGEVITESLTICEYVDAVSGPPRLFGSTPEERARIGMWERRAEMGLF